MNNRPVTDTPGGWYCPIVWKHHGGSAGKLLPRHVLLGAQGSSPAGAAVQFPLPLPLPPRGRGRRLFLYRLTFPLPQPPGSLTPDTDSSRTVTPPTCLTSCPPLHLRAPGRSRGADKRNGS